MSKVYLEDSVLTDIADAIREKTGESGTITPANMATEIESISGSAVIESKTITANGTYTAPEGVDGYSPVVVNVPSSFPQITFSEKLIYLNYHGVYDWLFRDYSNNITTEDIISMDHAFAGSVNLEDLSGFVINNRNNSTLNMSNAFNGSSSLKKLPRLSNSTNATDMNHAFEYNYNLRELGNDWENKITKVGDRQTSYNLVNMFAYCYSLRKLPPWISTVDTFYGNATNYSPYVSLCMTCSCLDEIVNLFPTEGGGNYTRNVFLSTVSNCFRLKKFTFKTDNGVPYVRTWKAQDINTTSCGFAPNNGELNKITGFNSGITADKQVTDAASYEALKNDPDWFTLDMAYSRYNHDSAVETINSLPDTSAYIATAGGTNTIRFKGVAGSATDGGAINTLTAEEIAVATNKGWTVTMI